MRWPYLIFFLLGCSLLHGQSILTGVVRDGSTNEPIPFVNIYLASTSTGATTDWKGKFRFKVSQPGKFSLVASYVGYTTMQIPVLLERDSVYEFEITLVTRNFQLQGIVVRADTLNRKRDLREFKRVFLGETENASRCHIINIKDIFVFYDKPTNVLSAYARAPIVVENKALGYKIYYDLQKFEIAYDSNALHIWGAARFEELLPEDENILNRWKRARRVTYGGSITHLMRSVLQNNLPEQGWEAVIIYPRIRPNDLDLIEKMKRLRDLDQLDSLRYYQYLKSLPPKSQMTSLPLKGHELVAKNNPHKIQFKGTLHVVYKRETADRMSQRQQWSEIFMMRRGMIVYDNGYYEPQNNLTLSGHLAWTERISEFLPYDYVPDAKKKKSKKASAPSVLTNESKKTLAGGLQQ